MTGSQDSARYFVVGGPVQPDRACYVLRDADALLYARLSEGEYCHIIGPPDTGKTSLIAHAAASLRGDGVAVANVDLAQISNRAVAEDVGRWYYSVAYRIQRELRVRFDLQDWWQEHAGLTNLQRMREFFREILLSAPDLRFVVFIDRIETALGHKESLDLFGAIRACYDARATEAEFERLSFALLGSAPPGKLIPSGQASPFDVSTAIPLADFDLEEVRRLASGLPCDAGIARVVAERVWHWTAGHPYLSQKILRALARRPSQQLGIEEVDQWVSNLFLTRNAAREEPHLSMVRSQLLRESRDKVARLSLYGKVRKGAVVDSEHALPTHRDLLSAGVLIEDSDGKLVLRNRVYGEVFTAHWVNRNLPFSWRGVAAVAAAVAFALAVPVWYTEYLPRPYIRTLNSPSADFPVAQEAYERLNMLPGFGGLAQQLFARHLERQSRRATRLIEVQRFGELLAELPGREPQAASLLAEFWDRNRQQAMRRADRDAAILYALRAMDQPTPARANALAELLGEDYESLRGSIRISESLGGMALDSDSGLVTLLDDRNRLAIWQVAETGPRRIRELELLAEEVIPLPGQVVVEGRSAGRRLSLSVLTDHPRPSEVQLELRAPSGRSARIMLTDGGPTGDGLYRLDSRRNPTLRPLLEESVGGTWTVYFTDLVQGAGGLLQAWNLEIDGQVAQPAAGTLSEPAPIPEPVATRQVSSRLGPAGKRALTWPVSTQVRGDVLVWNVSRGEVMARIPRGSEFSGARFALEQRALLVSNARNLELWDIERAELRLSIPYEPSLQPVLSGNGRYLVVDSVLADANNVLTVWDLETGDEVGRLVTGALVDLAQVDDSGQLLAVSDGERLIRLWNVPRSALVAELTHGSRPVAIRFQSGGGWLATQDAGHTLRLWASFDLAQPALTRQSASPWAVRFGAQQVLLGSIAHGYELIDLADLTRQGPVLRHGTSVPRRSRGTPAGRLGLGMGAGLALSFDGERVLRIWGLPTRQQDALPDAVAGSSVAAIGPDGRQLALGRDSGEVTILPVQPNNLLSPAAGQGPGFIGHLAPVTAIAFDTQGSLVASGAVDGSLRVWDVATGAPRRFFAAQGDGAVLDVAFSPDGEYIVSASRSSVLVTATASGETLARTPIQSRRPHLGVSGDGAAIYIGGDRGGLSSWLWRAGIVAPVLPADESAEAVAVMRGDGRFATVDENRRVQLWTGEAERLPQRARLPALPEYLWFSADDASLYAISGVWLQRLAVTSDGLRIVDTRLLTEPPVAARGLPGAPELLLLNGLRGSRLSVLRLRPDEPPASNLAPVPGQLAPGLEAALGLSLSDWGEPLALQAF